jgi:lysophospholipase L1-like esterase
MGFAEIFSGLIILCAIAAACELFAKLFCPYNASFKERVDLSIRYEPSGFICFFPIPNQKIYEIADGVIQYNKIRYEINQYGYRGENFAVQKAKDELRIAVLGGSHVFDVNSFDYKGDFGFPRLLQDLLRGAGYYATVINAGVPGYDTRHFLAQIIFGIQAYTPDIVIINSIWNDLKWISQADETTQNLRTPPKAVRKNPLTEKVHLFDTVLGASVLYRSLRDTYWQRRFNLHQDQLINEGLSEIMRAEIRDFTRGIKQYKDIVKCLVNIIKNMHATPLLAVEERSVSYNNTRAQKRKIPYHMVNVKSHEELVMLFSKCDMVLAEVASEETMPLINLQEELEDNSSYFYDHVHTTPEGSRFIAGRYCDFLKTCITMERFV